MSQVKLNHKASKPGTIKPISLAVITYLVVFYTHLIYYPPFLFTHRCSSHLSPTEPVLGTCLEALYPWPWLHFQVHHSLWSARKATCTPLSGRHLVTKSSPCRYLAQNSQSLLQSSLIMGSLTTIPTSRLKSTLDFCLCSMPNFFK